MIKTYSQMHHTDSYSQHSSIIWPVWLNEWLRVRLWTKWLWVRVISNINEVIRVVLNSLFYFLFFFYKKILHAPKAPKASKASKVQRRKQTKAQTQISEQKQKMRLKTSKGKKATYTLICVFALFVRAKKRK